MTMRSIFALTAFICTTQVSSAVASDASVSPAVSTPHTSIVLASAAGAALNSDLMKGGGTDDTAALQSILDRAKAGRAVHLVVDGPALVSGLEVYSRTIIECTSGGGLYLKNGSDRAILRNAHRSRDSIVDGNVTLRGCFLNGNRSGQRKGSAHPMNERQETDGTIKAALQFFGVNYLTIEKVFLWNCRTFAAHIANAKYITVRDVTVDANFPPYPESATAVEQRKYLDEIPRSNLDGLRFHGPIQYLTVDGLKLRTEDDALSLTANEFKDDITLENPLGPFVGQGPITDVTISNVVFMDALQGIRLLSSTQRIDRVLIQNVTGTVRHRMAIISPFLALSRGNVGAVSFTNIRVDQSRSANWRQLYPEWYQQDSPIPKDWENKEWDRDEEGEIPLFSFNGNIDSVTLSNVVSMPASPRPIIRVGRTSRIGLMDVDLSLIDAEARAIPLKLIPGGRVQNLNFALDGSGKAAIDGDRSSIGQLHWQKRAY